MVLNRLTSAQRLEIANDRMGSQDVVSSVLQADADKLRQTAETINRDDFADVVDAILNANKLIELNVQEYLRL